MPFGLRMLARERRVRKGSEDVSGQESAFWQPKGRSKPKKACRADGLATPGPYGHGAYF